MFKREGDGLNATLGEGQDNEGDLDLTVAEVIGNPGGNLLTVESPLAPSRPGCAGDLGTAAGVRIVDVVEEPTGLLHVMERPVHVQIGDSVPLLRDSERRNRLGRTHAAAIACAALLAEAGARVTSTEVVAGLAWIEVASSVPVPDLAPLAARDEAIEVLSRGRGRMTVYLDGQTVKTTDAPIATRTGAFAGAEARPVAALDGGREAFEVALPDGEGAIWWR